MNNSTYIYSDKEYEKMFTFIEKNIYDLPYYKKNKWRFSQKDVQKLNTDKEWIYKTYEELSFFYAEKATNIVIDYVNKTFQRGSLHIVRETLDFIVSLFGENIIYEFGTTNFTIIRLKEILIEQFNTERYEDVAYLICKEPELNLTENSRVKYKFSSNNNQNWTDLYEDEDYQRWFTFIEKNIYDLPYYKIYKSKFTPQKLQKLKTDKEWIYKTYEELSFLYAEKATNIVIDYVNKTFQRGSLNIVRETLDFIVSLFGKNIIEEFVDRDFSIIHLKEILMAQFNSERYEDVAYLICNQPGLNLAENSRVKYKWQFSNSLESKKVNLRLLKFFDPMGFGPLKRLEIKETLKGASEKTRREIKAYEDNMSKNWDICLPNERVTTKKEWFKTGKNCITLPYIRKDITYDDLEDIKTKIQSIHKEIATVIDSSPSLNKEEQRIEFHKIFQKYDLQEYILAEKKKNPTLEELEKYALELKIEPDKYTKASEIAFLILLKMLFPGLEEDFKNRNDLLNPLKNIGQYMSLIMSIYSIARPIIQGSEPTFKEPDIYNIGSDRIKITDIIGAENRAIETVFDMPSFIFRLSPELFTIAYFSQIFTDFL
jgi:hypothetical protein